MVVDSKGRVLLWEVVTFTALTVSTYIVEATMLGVGLMAVARWCQEHAIQLEYVALCSDNLAAVQDLQGGGHTGETGGGGGYGPHYLTRPPTGPTYVLDLGAGEHDSRKRDWLSNLNRVVDARAKVGGEGGGAHNGPWRRYGWKRRGCS